jgi:uncharacterized lipoprotein YddW (UPF0748 family)
MHRMKLALALVFAFIFFTVHAQQQPSKPEFRGVWIATLTNIDWPGIPTVSSEAQKTSFIKLLDMHQRNGMNAIIMQIRPSADAFYLSPYEPWSQWLTGIQGLPPDPLYDPLEFMIAETHKRGMEFHAWINPYRAIFNTTTSSITQSHITNLCPEWFLNYGDQKFFDPGNKEVQQYLVKIVKDVVKRYAVDAIHFDDYFYPYPIPHKEFPDNGTFKKYGNGLSRADWRRSNTDSIIAMTFRAIKEENSKCQFGISPFGVWRHHVVDPVNGSLTSAAPTNYDDLFADILLWLKNGWLDYIAPQLYWEMGHKRVAFEVLVDWWSHHTYGKNCYIGIGIYRTGSNMAWRDKTQIPRQVDKVRATPNIQGMVFYSSKTFEQNPYGIADTLRLNYFNIPAIVPKIAQ